MNADGLLLGISYLVSGTGVLNFADATTTLIGVGLLGKREGNPWVRWTFEVSPWLFVAIKLLVTVMLIYVSFRVYNDRYSLVEHKGMVTATFIVSAVGFLFYLLMVINNAIVIMEGG